MPLSDTFFDSNTWALTRNLTGFFVVVFWLATAFWVYKDARRRIDDPVAALRCAHVLGEPVLVVGSLYLLAELEAAETP